jgi:hypothetical protein
MPLRSAALNGRTLSEDERLGHKVSLCDLSRGKVVLRSVVNFPAPRQSFSDTVRAKGG